MSMHIFLDHLEHYMRGQQRCSAARLSTDVFETRHRFSRLLSVTDLKNVDPAFVQLAVKSMAVFDLNMQAGGVRVRAAMAKQASDRAAQVPVKRARRDCATLAKEALVAARAGRTVDISIDVSTEVCTAQRSAAPPPWAPLTAWPQGMHACPSAWAKAQSLVPPASLRCFQKSRVSGRCAGNTDPQGTVVEADVACPQGQALVKDAASVESRSPSTCCSLVPVIGTNLSLSLSLLNELEV